MNKEESAREEKITKADVSRSTTHIRPDPQTDAPTERPNKAIVIPVLYSEAEKVIMELMADLGFKLFPIMDVYIDKETMAIRNISFHNVSLDEKLFENPNIIVKRWDENSKPEGVSRPKIFGDEVGDEEDPEGLTQQEDTNE